jgi:hypothetical protein
VYVYERERWGREDGEGEGGRKERRERKRQY